MSQKERWYKRFWNFIKDAKAELNKVTWPSREEVQATTLVVILSIIFFGFFLFFMDVAFTWAISGIKKLVG